MSTIDPMAALALACTALVLSAVALVCGGRSSQRPPAPHVAFRPVRVMVGRRGAGSVPR